MIRGSEKSYHEDRQDWLQFGLIFTTSKFIPHRFIDFISQYFNQYPFLSYVFILLIYFQLKL